MGWILTIVIAVIIAGTLWCMSSMSKIKDDNQQEKYIREAKERRKKK